MIIIQSDSKQFPYTSGVFRTTRTQHNAAVFDPTNSQVDGLAFLGFILSLSILRDDGTTQKYLAEARERMKRSTTTATTTTTETKKRPSVLAQILLWDD